MVGASAGHLLHNNLFSIIDFYEGHDLRSQNITFLLF